MRRVSQGYRSRNSTADRALDILLLFRDDVLVLTGNRVAEHLGVARSTAYRYLQSLTSMGFLEENEVGAGFRLGPRVFDLARIARRGVGLSELARPVMRDLAQATGHPVLLTRRAGTAVVCLEREDVSQTLRLSYERGQVLPLNAGAAALALIAWTPQAELAELLAELLAEPLDAPLTRFTEATVTDPAVLVGRLAQIRERGHAVARGELDPDVLGVAAPVRGRDGGVVAALSIAALAHRVSDEEVPMVASAVTKAAGELTDLVIRLDAA
jgi:DNA-binding IclR family transcriptional regulator